MYAHSGAFLQNWKKKSPAQFTWHFKWHFNAFVFAFSFQKSFAFMGTFKKNTLTKKQEKWWKRPSVYFGPRVVVCLISNHVCIPAGKITLSALKLLLTAFLSSAWSTQYLFVRNKICLHMWSRWWWSQIHSLLENYWYIHQSVLCTCRAIYSDYEAWKVLCFHLKTL